MSVEARITEYVQIALGGRVMLLTREEAQALYDAVSAFLGKTASDSANKVGFFGKVDIECCCKKHHPGNATRCLQCPVHGSYP
jgi:hypothetical protein